MMSQHTIQGVHVRRGTEQRLEKEKSSGHTGDTNSYSCQTEAAGAVGGCTKRLHPGCAP